MNGHDEIRDMLLARASKADAAGLLQAAIATASTTPQLRRSGSPKSTRLLLAGFLAAGLAATLVAVWLGSGSQPPPGGSGHRAGSSGASPSATQSPSLSPTDVPLTPPPYAEGSCPVTPLTDLAGGSAPEVVTSGVRWRWGGSSWRAGVGQKLLVLPTTDDATFRTSGILASRLSVGSVGAPVSAIYPGDSEVFGVGLPLPGCWLLTLVGPDVHSSVVVSAVSAPASPPPPGRENVPTAPARRLRPPATCPASRLEPSASVRTWLDDAVAWQDPDPAAWLPGMPRKLVVRGTGDDQPFERLVAVPVVSIDSTRPALLPSVPAIGIPAPGGGNKAAMLTLPAAGCWAITYLDPHTTSTIVVEVP